VSVQPCGFPEAVGAGRVETPEVAVEEDFTVGVVARVQVEAGVALPL